jgi:single-strand DNA-binding protein
MAINTYIFSGNLGGDAEVKTLESGSSAITFNVAVSEAWKDKSGEKKEKTTWVKCTKWVSSNGSTKIADYLKKGQTIIVQGKPEARAYIDKLGDAKSSLEVNVSELTLVGRNESSGSSSSGSTSSEYGTQNPTYGQSSNQETSDGVDDLPF